ncbi:MAG: DUF393 domain-containing protein [Armatimonadetes bacterium]|nr:DUF393 domain-containing protein [Armatimonadota bacterium]
MASDGPILLFDGVCALCNGVVQWLLSIDTEQHLRYAPLQGETARRMRELHPEIPESIDTVVLADRGRVYLRSRAFIETARYLPYPWRLGRLLRWIPSVLLDALYRVIAAIRYRVWGKLEACRLPRSEERDLFLP